MTGHIFREIRGVVVQEFSPVENRVVAVRFQPDDGEHNSMDAVFDEIGFPEAPSSRARKVLLNQDLRNILIPRVLAQTATSLVWQLDERVVLVASVLVIKHEPGRVLNEAAFLPLSEWEDSGFPEGRALDAWRRSVLKRAIV